MTTAPTEFEVDGSRRRYPSGPSPRKRGPTVPLLDDLLPAEFREVQVGGRLREKLAAETQPGLSPQALFRVGYPARQPRPTPRRPLSAVLPDNREAQAQLPPSR